MYKCVSYHDQCATCGPDGTFVAPRRLTRPLTTGPTFDMRVACHSESGRRAPASTPRDCSRMARGPQRGPGRRSGVRTAVPCRTAAPAGEPPRPSSSATPRSTPAAPSSRFVTGSTVETTHPQPINEAEQHAARGQSPQKAHTHTQRRRSCAAADRRRTLTPPARRCRRRRGVPHGWLSCPPPWWQPTTRALCLASGRRHRGR